MENTKPQRDSGEELLVWLLTFPYCIFLFFFTISVMPKRCVDIKHFSAILYKDDIPP